MSNTMLRLLIQEHLKDDFLTFLDIAQSNFTEDDIQNFSEGELEVLKIVEEILVVHGVEPSKRYTTLVEKHKSAQKFHSILGINK